MNNPITTVFAIAMIGLYIYPAGENIAHDPTFEAGSFQPKIVGEVNPVIVLLLLLSVGVVCGISLVTVLVLRNRSRNKGRFRYQAPPQYRHK